MMHPDQFGRTTGSYDPDEPLAIRYADAIAARNAVGALYALLHDPQFEIDDMRLGLSGLGLALSVAPNDAAPITRETREDSVAWLKALVHRLNGVLPWPGNVS